MKLALIIASILMVLTGSALAQDRKHSDTSRRDQQQGFDNSWDNKNTYMKPYNPDAYGPGVHSDATGKPFEWKTQDGQTSHSKKVKPDGYGLGVGRDEYGRPVKPSEDGVNNGED